MNDQFSNDSISSTTSTDSTEVAESEKALCWSAL
jgi:hypothetical protein